MNATQATPRRPDVETSGVEVRPGPRATSGGDPDGNRPGRRPDDLRVGPIPEPGTGSRAAQRPEFALSLTSVIAGAGAAVTSAVVGAQLGTAGTLVGAAIGAVVGAVATALFTYGLERSRHLLTTGGPLRGSLVVGLLVTVVAGFALAMGAITAVERSVGTSLSGQRGTTVQIVSGDAPAPAAAQAIHTGDVPGQDVHLPAWLVHPEAAANPQTVPAPSSSARPEPSASAAPSVSAEATPAQVTPSASSRPTTGPVVSPIPSASPTP